MPTSADVPYLDDEMQQRIISVAASLIPEYQQAASELTLVTLALDQAMADVVSLGPVLPDDVAFDYELQLLHWYIAAMISALHQERTEHANTIAYLQKEQAKPTVTTAAKG